MSPDELWTTGLRAVARELARELAPLLVDALRATDLAARPSSPTDGDQYLSVLEACKKYGFSRSTFDRMLADPQSGLAAVVVRVPPVTGRVKVPVAEFDAWLRARKNARRSRRAEPS